MGWPFPPELDDTIKQLPTLALLVKLSLLITVFAQIIMVVLLCQIAAHVSRIRKEDGHVMARGEKSFLQLDARGSSVPSRDLAGVTKREVSEAT